MRLHTAETIGGIRSRTVRVASMMRATFATLGISGSFCSIFTRPDRFRKKHCDHEEPKRFEQNGAGDAGYGSIRGPYSSSSQPGAPERRVDDATLLRQEHDVAHDFPESDWRVLRELRPRVLQRLCERALGEIKDASTAPDENFHERFLAVYKLVHERNEDIARAFDDPRRSRAFLQLAAMKSLGLIAPEELKRFSAGVRETLNFLMRDD